MSRARNLGELLEADGEVPSGKIDSVDSSKLTGTVSVSRLAAGSIDSAHVAAGAVDDAHISGLAATKLTGTVASARLGSGTANTTTFLRGDNAWAVVDTNLVADTSPQLGGDLDLNSNNITGTGGIPAGNLTGTIAGARLSTATTQAESDDSTKIATTAYVVDKITTLIGGAPSTLNDLNELALAINDDASYNSTLTTALATKLPLAGGTMTGDLILNDNVKLEVGSASGGDLQIYHDGSNSYIAEAGTGDLIITSNTHRVRTDQFQINNAANNKILIQGLADGAATLYHNGSDRLATTAAGATLTGNLAVTGTVDGIDIATRDAILTSTTTTAGAALPKAGGSMTGALNITASGTGMTFNTPSTSQNNWITWKDGGTNKWEIGKNTGNNFYVHSYTLGSTVIYLKETGFVGIGTTSPNDKLHVVGSLFLEDGSPEITFETAGAAHANWQLAAQEHVSNAFEISSGSQDSDASNDTFTPRLTILNNGNSTFSGTVTATSFTGSGAALTGIDAATVSTTAPSSPAAGDMWFDSTSGTAVMYVWSGSAWDQMSNKFSATGGTVTTASNYKYHTFTSSGTFTSEGAASVDFLLVAGGASSGSTSSHNGSWSGGGGAGGAIQTNSYTVSAQDYSIVIGAGGSHRANGSNSTAFGSTAIGGGYPGTNIDNAANGGSGGGAGGDNASYINGQGSGTSGQGNAGGAGYDPAPEGCGGGGGKGAVGGAAGSGGAGTGGAGINLSAWATATSTGDGGYYAGGGGGASGRGDTGGASNAAGGAGGGGTGGVGQYASNAGAGGARNGTAGDANTGGGAGGAGAINGGSGIVIIRYQI